MRQSLRWTNLFGITQLDALCFHELGKPFTVAADIALHFGQCWKVLPVCLSNIEDIDGAEAGQLRLRFLRVFGLLCVSSLSVLADHRGENENAFLPAFNEAAKRVMSECLRRLSPPVFASQSASRCRRSTCEIVRLPRDT